MVLRWPGAISGANILEDRVSQPWRTEHDPYAYLFASVPWWRLVPDAEGSLVTGGAGTGQDRAVAAMIDDRSLALVYLLSTRKVRVKLLRLQGRSVTARWYAPAEGRYITAKGVRMPVTEAHSFRPPPSVGGFEKDWVLVLAAAS